MHIHRIRRAPRHNPATGLVGHFPEAKFDLSASEVAILDDAQATEVKTDFCTFDTIMPEYATYVFQAHGDFPDVDKEDRIYRANGGGLQPPLMATRMDGCAEFGSLLGRQCVKSALVYGFHVARNVRRSNRRCNNRACGSIYWRNYRYVRRQKLSAQEGGPESFSSTPT